MLTKTKIALAAVLFAGTASLAVAQEADPNLFNRYPAYNGAGAAQENTFQSAPVGLYQGRNVGQSQRTTAGSARGYQSGSTERFQSDSAQPFPYDSAPLISGGGGY